jgi:hypothetical protein
MSNFNDKALKGVAEAVSKIVDEELKGNQHKIDANKNGKIDAHDFKLLRAKKTIKEDDVGYQHRYSVKNGKATVHNPAKGEKDEPHHVYADSEEHAVRKHAAQTKPTVKEEVKKNEYHIAGKHKFPTKDEHAVTVKHTESGREHVHSGKGKYLSKLIKSRYDINHHFESVELDEAFPTVDDAKKRMSAGKTSTGSVTKTKTGLVHKRDHAQDDTESNSKGYGARQNYSRSDRVNEKPGQYKKKDAYQTSKSGIKVHKMADVGGDTGERIETAFRKHYKESLSFTEMLELYNEHGVEVISKIAPQTVKFGDTEVELIDADEVNGVVGITVAEEVDNETFTKEVEAQKEKNAGRGKKAEVAKASVQAVKMEEVEQIDEISKGTLGSYIKKASHDVAAKGAITRHFADKSRAETAAKKHDLAKDSMKRSDRVFASGWKRREGMAKAVDRLTKEDVQLDEKLPASASAGDYIHDFVHSDNPKFASKSKEERKKMALGAFYAKSKGK